MALKGQTDIDLDTDMDMDLNMGLKEDLVAKSKARSWALCVLVGSAGQS
jgi:hypothetical protein